MFWNIYSKRVLSSIRNKEQMFWVFLFPLLLATLFYFTLSGIDNAERLETISVGVVDRENWQGSDVFKGILDEAENGNSKLFQAKEFPELEDGDKALKAGEIEGCYVLEEGGPRLLVKSDGISQTVLKSFLDQYLQTEAVSVDMGMAVALENLELTETISLSNSPYSAVVNYYYALLALVCLYGGMQGMASITFLQGNLSALGARRMMSPVSRLRHVCYDLLGGVTVQVLNLMLLMFYVTVILGVDFGRRTGLLILTCIAGSLLGVGFGAAISCLSKVGEGLKSGILFSFSLISCAAAGMMVEGMRYAVEQKAPVLSWLNPAARIADAFYSLYYFDDYYRYLLNMGVILTMAAVFFLLTAVSLRRQQYESI